MPGAERESTVTGERRTEQRESNSGASSRRGGALIAAGGKVDADLVRAAATAVGEDAAGESDGARDEDGALTVEFKLAHNLKKRLDKYLQDRITFMSRTQLQRLIKEEAVLVNGRPAKASTTLRQGDEVSVIVPPPPASEIPAEDIPLRVLYEDDDLIVINKQNDIIVHPARGNKTGTVLNALAFHFKHRSSGALSEVGKDEARPGVVHRLDRYTTGALIAAKTELAHWRLSKQFADRTTDKRYLAVVHGTVEPALDTIELPIGKHPKLRELMAVRFDETAKASVTIYRVRAQFDGYALVELELKTGRTHQIRVHLAHLGWPIVGDDRYGGKLLQVGEVVHNAGRNAGEPLMHRQALHAWSIAFTHPRSGERMEFKAPLPGDYRRLLNTLRTQPGDEKILSPPGAVIDLNEVG